ncbi:MAG: phosphoribosylformylglycinamidine cyclo-ligase [Spirochaetales bacterium]|nr:phosphoribosylformylglycinamidine cyclo-ligase [Spirochaetales bacterium]
MENKKTYAQSGVDIEKGDKFAEFIARFPSKAVSKGLGGFAGGVELDWARFKRPLLLSCTDGVGTKLLVAQKLGVFDTVGIDLVAMNVNDLAVCGCFPEVFLDYIAIGTIDDEKLQALIKGVIEGCEQAECILAGGETAEMPDLYHDGDFDLAGFCVGLVEKDEVLPHPDRMAAGDMVFGVASSGVHSNGYSLARKCLYESDTEGWKQLLTPTKIYVKTMKALVKLPGLQGAAHITGGGLYGNIERVLPAHLQLRLDWNWNIPEIFHRIEKGGNVDRDEMIRVFNMGVGLALVVNAAHVDAFEAGARQAGVDVFRIGALEAGSVRRG